jgi:hypothetical protein
MPGTVNLIVKTQYESLWRASSPGERNALQTAASAEIVSTAPYHPVAHQVGLLTIGTVSPASQTVALSHTKCKQIRPLLPA